MKLLLDQGAPRSAAEILRSHDLDAVHAGECGLAEADDSEIIEWAARDNRVIVTLDADFHALLVLSRSLMPSVIRIRQQSLRALDFSAIVRKVVDECSVDIQAGALISVTTTQIRIRRLPVR